MKRKPDVWLVDQENRLSRLGEHEILHRSRKLIASDPAWALEDAVRCARELLKELKRERQNNEP